MELKAGAEFTVDDKRYRVVELDWRELGYPEENSVGIMLYAEELDSKQTMLKDASIGQYLEWLSGYFMRGGRPTHSYGYEFKSFHYADKVFTVNGECGSNAKNVILANGAELHNPNRYMPSDGFGHNNIFFMDGFRSGGVMGWVPIYSNPEFDRYRDYIPARNLTESDD